MNWNPLVSASQLETIAQQSFHKPQMIFKHSTRCSISVMVKSRLERSTPPEGVDFFYLDLLNYRPISNQIAEQFQVHHESPQILLISQGECVYAESHQAINMEEIIENIG